MAVLDLVQRACRRMAIDVPSALFSSTDTQIVQLRALATEEGIELAKSFNWQAITKEKTFTTVAQEVQTSGIASDFDRLVNYTMYNRTENRELIGPLNAHEWQREKAGPVYTSVYNAFRFRGDSLMITPDPTAGQTIAYEYVSENWCESSLGVERAYFLADGDTSFLDEDLISLGVEWRFLKAKGFDYSEPFRIYQMLLEKKQSRDGGSPNLNIGVGLLKRRFMPEGNVKEGSWP